MREREREIKEEYEGKTGERKTEMEKETERGAERQKKVIKMY